MPAGDLRKGRETGGEGTSKSWMVHGLRVNAPGGGGGGYRGAVETGAGFFAGTGVAQRAIRRHRPAAGHVEDGNEKSQKERVSFP